MINWEVRNKWVKTFQDKGSILHAIICICILYNFCLQIVYIMCMMYALSRSDLMYTKCVQNACIQNVSHLSTKCCIQNEYKMYIYKIYITLRQTFVYILYTKFSWRSSFDFVYKMYTKVCRNMVCILYIFCRH